MSNTLTPVPACMLCCPHLSTLSTTTTTHSTTTACPPTLCTNPPMYRALCVLLGASLCAGQGFTAAGGAERDAFLRSSLQAANGWLSEEVRREKYDKMGASVFSFFRGTAHLYYADLQAQGVRGRSSFAPAGTTVWVQGDMHTENIGIFQDDAGEIVADLNDFDEGGVTTYLNDVWRFAASIVLVAERREGFSSAEINGFIDTFTQRYLSALQGYRGNNNEVTAKFTSANTYGGLDSALLQVQESKSRGKMLEKWTEMTGEGRRMRVSYKKLAAVPEELTQALTNGIGFQYHRNLTGGSVLQGKLGHFAVKSVAQRLRAGTGSYGTPRYYVLVEGPTMSEDDDIILDVKQQTDPSVTPYLPQAEKDAVASRWQGGCRVAVAQAALRNNEDNHLGCLQVGAQSFSVRQRSPFKEDFDTTQLTSAAQMTQMCEQWGAIIAAAHARSDNDFNPNVIPHSFEDGVHGATAGRVAAFQKDIRDFAIGYAAQAKIDYGLFQQILGGGEGGGDDGEDGEDVDPDDD